MTRGFSWRSFFLSKRVKPDPLDNTNKYYVKRGYLAVEARELIQSPKVQQQLDAVEQYVPIQNDTTQA